MKKFVILLLLVASFAFAQNYKSVATIECIEDKILVGTNSSGIVFINTKDTNFQLEQNSSLRLMVRFIEIMDEAVKKIVSDKVDVEYSSQAGQFFANYPANTKIMFYFYSSGKATEESITVTMKIIDTYKTYEVFMRGKAILELKEAITNAIPTSEKVSNNIKKLNDIFAKARSTI